MVKLHKHLEMKKITFLICFLTISQIALFAQSSEDRNLPSFDKLVVSCEVKVFLIKGYEEKAKINVSNISIADVETTVNGKTLTIELSRGIHKDANVEIYLTYKELRDINVGASGSVSVQNPIEGDRIVLNANTNGELQAEINLKAVDIKVGQGAVVRLSGRTGSMDAKVSTKGILSALDLQSDSTYVQVGSGGLAKVNAISLIDANIKTGGTLTYSGTPKDPKIKKGIGATVTVLE